MLKMVLQDDTDASLTELRTAVQIYDKERIRYLVEEEKFKPGPEALELLSRSLYGACRNEDVDMVKWLLQQGVHANGATSTVVQKLTPLHIAATLGKVDLVSLLIQNGADVNARWGNSSTPLMDAARAGHDSTVKILLASNDIQINLGNSIRGTPLITAIEQGHEHLVNLFLENGIDLSIRDNLGRGPIFHAAMRRLPGVIRKLVAAGCSTDVPERKGRYPIHLACTRGYLDIVNVLIECGCNVNVAWGRPALYTPLSEAVVNGHYKVIQKLFEAGALPNYNTTEKHWSALGSFCASAECNLDILHLLIQNGCNVNFKMAGSGYSILHCAYDKDWFEAATFMLLSDCKVELEHWLAGVSVDDISNEACATFVKLAKTQVGVPMKLKQQCRLTIKNILLDRLPYMNSVKQLHLPPLLERYLLYEL